MMWNVYCGILMAFLKMRNENEFFTLAVCLLILMVSLFGHIK